MCIEEQTLELYVLGRLAEPVAEAVEDHLVLCEGCQNRAENIRETAAAIQTAFKEDAAKASGKLAFISGGVERKRLI